MQNKIHILPEFIANQIAAGEVVQRPESVVKELVENSLDAGADSIAVIVRDAGKQLIHIVDNGCGMTLEDLKLSCRRHSTSKIYTQEDLEAIRSFGFRGEALASISSVSKLEIRTKQADDSGTGWKLISEPMQEIKVEQIAMDKGTQIFVRNLFYNVPARRKFLRANLTEFRYISNTMLKFALSDPNIHFTFYDDDNLIFDLLPDSLIGRIAKLFSEEIANSVIPLNSEDIGIKISGYIGEPSIAKKTKANQFLCLNKRSIYSRSLSHAVFTAMENLIGINFHPFYIIFIEIDPSLVDVNVHPQKHEVKFEDEKQIYNLLLRSVKESLAQNSFIPIVDIVKNTDNSIFSDNSMGACDTFIVNRKTGEIIEPVEIADKYKDKFSSDIFKNSPTRMISGIDSKPFKKEDLSAYDALFGIKNEPERQIFNTDDIKESLEVLNIFEKYLLVTKKNELIVINIKAARQKILYEEVLKMITNSKIISQKLLFPVNQALSLIEKQKLTEFENEFREFAYEFSFIENNRLEISAVPAILPPGTEAQSLMELLNNYDINIDLNTKKRQTAEIIAKAAAQVPMQSFSKEDMQNLYYKLMKCPAAQYLFNGKKTYIQIEEAQFRDFLIKMLEN